MVRNKVARESISLKCTVRFRICSSFCYNWFGESRVLIAALRKLVKQDALRMTFPPIAKNTPYPARAVAAHLRAVTRSATVCAGIVARAAAILLLHGFLQQFAEYWHVPEIPGGSHALEPLARQAHKALYDPSRTRRLPAVWVLSRTSKAKQPHALIDQGSRYLKTSSHRGAIADPSAGDGAGILIPTPRPTFAPRCVWKTGHHAPRHRPLVVGMVFLPREPASHGLRTRKSNAIHAEGKSCWVGAAPMNNRRTLARHHRR